MLSVERLKELLDYEPATGRLLWKVKRNSFRGRVKPGEPAGCIGTHGYRLIRLEGTLRHAHQWVWYWHTGEWPDKQTDIDHINGNRDDNRFENLRIARRAENMWNGKMRVDNSSGYPGVVQPKGRTKWDARIKVDGEFYFLGAFYSYKEAVAARKAAEKLFHGDFRRRR